MLSLRYYQKEAVDCFFKYTEENWGKHPIMVMPTGSGKSLVQAYIVKHMLEYPGTRVLLLTHQQYLIQQNFSELMDNFGNDMFLDVGIHSAGLKRRDTRNRILFAGIQSVYKKAWDLGFFDLILVDECHLIPHDGEGMYRTFLSEMEKINPKIVIGGLSATAYRMKHGLLTEGDGALFDDICYEASLRELIDPNHFKNYDKKQYLCDLISKNGVNKVDLSGVHIRGGEYVPGEMERAFQANDLVCRAVNEIKGIVTNRKKVLVFTAGIAHCEEVVEKMNAQGLAARSVHSDKTDEENKKNIQDFKRGMFNFLVNVNSLTTGFNEKAIDCIIFLRSTMSPGLYVQMAGRGLRMHSDKENCLILDFGRNIERHGPIDRIEIRKKKDGTGHEVHTLPQKECPVCQALLSISVMICPSCGHEFPQKDKHNDTASEADVISKWKKPETMDVSDISYSRHRKEGKPDSLRVDFHIRMLESYSTWVCVEHEGFAGQKAQQWLGSVSQERIKTVSEALYLHETFRKIEKIIVNLNGRFPQITGYIYEDMQSYRDRMNEAEKEKQNQITSDLAKVMF